MEKPQPIKLTADQLRKWSDTRVSLLFECPAFAHIFYSMLNKAGHEHIALFTKDIPVAATDGSNLILNPETFFKLPLKQRLFACAHEILHCILNHLIQMHRYQHKGKIVFTDGKSLPYDQQTANIAMDMVINDILIDSKVGEFNKDWIHAPQTAGKNDSWLDAYRKIYKKPPPGGVQFDLHLPPGAGDGKDPRSAEAERNDQEWKTQVAAAAHAARVQGKLPGGLERVLGEVLDPKVDWREHIRSLFARRVGNDTYDWRRVDRRLIVRDIVAPGRSGFGCGTVVCAIDTSGSIGPDEVDMFLAEVSGILEDVKPRELYIMWCDAQVHRVDEADEPGDLNTIRHKGAPGGGGTSFIPVFEEIAKREIEPDALVYLTDLCGSFPQQTPSYPVIWGSIMPNMTVPFGDIVEVPKA